MWEFVNNLCLPCNNTFSYVILFYLSTISLWLLTDLLSPLKNHAPSATLHVPRMWHCRRCLYIKILTNKDTLLVPVNDLLSHYLYYSLKLLTAIKKSLQRYCSTAYSRSNQMWIFKNSKERLENLKSRDFSKIDSTKTYDFSTLYTTIPHNKYFGFFRS
jgi:hypothetical protein